MLPLPMLSTSELIPPVRRSSNPAELQESRPVAIDLNVGFQAAVDHGQQVVGIGLFDHFLQEGRIRRFGGSG